jgi:5S rRNA maturation endonuclease (ribonuclease M5)
VTGKAPHKYDTPQDMKRGYCDRLTHGEPAYIVEGEIDALRLMAAGFPNVIAIGGAKMSEEITQLLNTNEIRQITYIPDLEYNDQGERKTKIINEAIRGFQSATVDGERVITHLYIGEIPTPEGATLSNYKTDPDTYGKEHGADALRTVALNDLEWWDYELAALDSWATDTLAKGATLSRCEFERRFMDIYTRCATPIERERIRRNIDGVPLYAEQGITPAALLDVDEWNRQTDYTNRIKAGLQALTRAVDDGANPETVGDILAKMSEAQSTNTRGEWEKQLNATFADELRAINEQPDTLRTKWELGTMAPDKMGLELKFHRYEYIEFFPADITVFCAPTSHGKTMILFQSALDMVRNTDKLFLYVSCEENNRQLLERALNVYLDIPTTDTGRDDLNNYCFITGTRKRAIKAALRGGFPNEYAEKYNDYQTKKGGAVWTWSSEHPTPPNWENLSRRILAGVEQYGERIRPRLKFIHTEGSAESIAQNVRHYVEQYRAQGVDVGGVFVDYMQLLTSDNNSYSRHDELKDVCKALKDCAACIELPVIIAAQLNRYAIAEGVDSVTVANIGEGADIERIAHDIYLIWQVDKTKQDLYYTNVYPKGQDGKADKTQEPTRVLDYSKTGDRSRRIFKKTGTNEIELKRGYLYIEQMKARDGKTDGWGLFPFKGEQGQIGTIDTAIMEQ